jgi:uncharacterized membrane protein
MRFAVALPWWGYALVFGLAVALAWAAYARIGVPMSRARWTVLVALRAATLVLVAAALLRPVQVIPSTSTADRTLPILVDVSRSMRLADEGSAPRIDRARSLAADLTARLGAVYKVEVLTFGETLERASSDQLEATARLSDLTGALAATAERYRQTRLAGVVVLSDGGETSHEPIDAGRLPSGPVFTVGVGSTDAPRDRELVNLTAGEAILPAAAIDLSVSAVSHGYGTAPLEMRLSANGRPVDVRRVSPVADGAPVHQVFTVSPSADSATLYTVEIPPADGELAAENNRRSILVEPPTARRTILVVEGAPGFEHTFLKRALASDRGLDVDSVVRKGQNDDGRDTFFVQAAERRAAALSPGFPTTRQALFQYDAIVFGNVEAAFFTRAQLDLTARFVAERGGGLLVLGGRSFERQGLTGTPLEEVLPVDLADRRPTARPAAGGEGQTVNAPAPTADGVTHPATRLAASLDESRKIWQALPPLASVAIVGGPRPGAQILAVAASPGGDGHPLIAVQRYGQGRAMVFSGEASWRWRMLRPASDDTYDTIWRQMVRWLAAAAPGPVSISPMVGPTPGTMQTVSVLARDEQFMPVANAEVTLTMTTPDGQSRALVPTLANPREGRYLVSVPFEQRGVYRFEAEARTGSTRLGSATRQVLAGGTDLEMADPQLNEPVLERIASATGGAYLPAAEVEALPAMLQRVQEGVSVTDVRDLWHNVWTLLGIMGLLAAEWVVRRGVGLA